MKKQFITEARRLQKLAGIIKEGVSLDGKQVNTNSIEIKGIDMEDFPDFVDAYITYAEYADGTELTDEELEQFQEENYDLIGELIHDRQLYNR